MISTIAMFVKQAIIQGIPLLYGSTGEMVTEKSGNLNLGIPGIMYIGGISGVIGAYFYEKSAEVLNPFLCVLIPLMASLLGSIFLSLIYSFLTITLRANQNVTGLALTTFGIGVGNFFGGSLSSLFGEGGSISLLKTGACFKATLPFADKLGLFGDTFLSFGFLAYLAIAIALVASWVLGHTRIGLNLRAAVKALRQQTLPESMSRCINTLQPASAAQLPVSAVFTSLWIISAEHGQTAVSATADGLPLLWLYSHLEAKYRNSRLHSVRRSLHCLSLYTRTRTQLTGNFQDASVCSNNSRIGSDQYAQAP